MAESDGEERTQEATPKRQQEAREKGQIPRSKELGTAVTLLGAAGVFLVLGNKMLAELMRMVSHGLTPTREEIFDVTLMWPRFVQMLIEGALLIVPLLLLVVVAAIGSAVALGGWNFTVDAISFKPEKLNPVTGMGRIFSLRGLLEMFKGFIKFAVVAGITVLVLRMYEQQFLGLGSEPVMRGLIHAGSLIGWSFLAISASMLLLAAVDVPFQLWDHHRQLKMTMQEVKEEYKQTEGSPEIKGRQRKLQMQMAQRRMMAEVPKADVVVTNPTHYAVALRYDQVKMNAPILVAKGSDLLAARIREVAAEHKVPILSAPPLARSLYHTTELNEIIPAGLYRAVAQVLAYVYHLRQGTVYSASSANKELKDLPIPEELRRD